MDEFVGSLEVVEFSAAFDRGGFFTDNREVLAVLGDHDEEESLEGGQLTGSSQVDVEIDTQGAKVVVSEAETGVLKKGGGNQTLTRWGAAVSQQRLQKLFIPITTGIFSIGRVAGVNRVVVRHSATSLVHLMMWSIKFDETSTPVTYLKDMSLNGVFVDGNKVGRNNTVVLSDGAMIEIKKALVFQFRSLGDQHNSPETEIGKLALQQMKCWTITKQLLGFGSFGAVFVAKKHTDMKNYAVKVVKNKKSDKIQHQSRLVNESDILQRISHPNIIKVHDTFILDDFIYIFEDLVCGGDLFSYLVRGDNLSSIPESEVIVIVYQMLIALDFLHNSLQIIHRDLKLDNVLLKLPMPCTRIILCDFGIAKPLGRPNKRTQTVVGTVEYSAPEIFECASSALEGIKSPGYGFACDMWSLGVMIHIMLSGISPFYCNGENNVKSAKLGKLDLDRSQWRNVSSLSKDLVSKLLEVNPDKRYKVSDCFSHHWISKHRVQLDQIYKSKILKD